MKLDISGHKILGCEQKLAYHIEDALKQAPRLKRLHIRKAGLTDEAVARIANGLNFTNNLSILDLSANKLSRDRNLFTNWYLYSFIIGIYVENL